MTPPEMAFYSALAPAAVALLTALGTIYLTHYFSSKREDDTRGADESKSVRARRREKLEQLVEHVLQSEDDTSRRQLAIGALGLQAAAGVTLEATNEPPIRLDPFELAHAIQMLYFPSLSAVFLTLMEGRKDAATFNAEEAAALSDAAKWKAEKQPDFGTRAAASLATLHRGILDLHVEARRIMEQEKLS